MRDRLRSVLIGAAFLMATSAIGPGFLTQTAVFTERLGPSFGFAILLSVVIDLAAQLNIWRVIAVSGRRAGDIADDVAPGLGRVLAFLVALGGLAFNVGNVAGAGLGVQVTTGLPVWLGAAGSGRIRPLSAPTRMSVRTGRPMTRKISVERVMKTITTRCQWSSSDRCIPRRKLTEVYAAPTTEVIAALHITTPKIR